MKKAWLGVWVDDVLVDWLDHLVKTRQLGSRDAAVEWVLQQQMDRHMKHRASS